jgi:multidrug efflux pump subunit AcrA (membrane-fusion protein)
MNDVFVVRGAATAPAKQQQWLWVRRGIFVTFAGMAVLIAGCARKDEAPKAKADPTVPVVLAAVSTDPVQRTVEVVGTLWGDEDAVISAKVPGRVAAVLKDVGDRAEANEPLAQIEKVDYETARKQKQSAVLEALSKLGLKDFPKGEFDPANVPTVQKAKLQEENAESRYKRAEQLHEQSPPALSDQDFQDMKTTYEVARSNYDVELLTAQSLLTQARTQQADLEIADQRLVDTTVRAPVGVTGQAATSQPSAAASTRSYGIASRMVSVGEYVKEGTPMFRLIADDPVKLRASVPERYIAEVKVGQNVSVRVESYQDAFKGKLTRINPQVDPANRTFQIEAVIANPERLLKPGSFARASVLTRTDPKVVFAPIESVTTFAGVSKVFTVNNGKAKEMLVETGDHRDRDNTVEIVKGLQGDEKVVVEGVSKLATGVPVKIRSKPGPATAATAAVAGTAQSVVEVSR